MLHTFLSSSYEETLEKLLQFYTYLVACGSKYCQPSFPQIMSGEKGNTIMSVPTYTQIERNQPRQSRRMFWVIIGGATLLVLFAFAAYVGFSAYSAINAVKQNGSIPERYYINILSGDYTTAYSYMDSNATINGQSVGDQQAFIRLAKAADTRYGTVHGISFSTESDTTHVTVTVSRGSTNYDVHLVLKQENGAWKIVNTDGI